MSESRGRGAARRRRDYLVMLCGEASTIAVIQVLPMLLLPVDDYAAYSAIYLGYAASITVKFAVLSDVWARRTQLSGASETAGTYLSVLTSIALLGGAVVATITALVASDLVLGAVALAAVTLGVFRAGAVYRLIGSGQVLRAGVTESIGAASAAVVALFFSLSNGYGVLTAVLCWALVPLVASGCTPLAPRLHVREVRSWLWQNRREIRTLSSESMIKNIESVGTPFVLAGVGGLAALALYRAGSSLTYPVRFLIDAVRARIVNGAVRADARTLGLLTLIGALLGGAVAGTILGAELLGIGQNAVLGLLADHAPAVWAWVWVTALSTFVQFSARGSFTPRALVIRRIAHTIIIMLGTALAVLLLGLGAVVWAAAATRVLALPLWLIGGRS